MADTLTPNLKLRISDDLTSDAKYNLNRIDSLGGAVKNENNGNLRLRAIRDIIFSPESQDLGGEGSGGTIFLGESGSSLASLAIFSDEVDFNNAILTGFSIDEEITDSMVSPTAAINATKIADGSVSNTEFQYLAGATSNLQAQINALGGANQMSATWANADGTTKVITHNFGTRNISVEIIDADNNYRTIQVDTVERNTINEITLTASQAPTGSWIVLLAQVGT